MKKMLILTLLALAGLGLQAGKLAQVYNAEFEIDGNPSMKDVESAIKKALVGRGWMVKKTETGEIHATIQVRSHTARILIHYSRKSVKIEYVDSNNLNYKEKGGTPMIHNNYNRWIMLLERDIQNKLM